MPTYPLYTLPSSPDAWHQVTSPGGYEWWHFDAEDEANDQHFAARFFDGYIDHPEYLQRYARYARQPTRHAPPLPQEYIFVQFAFYRAGKSEHQFLMQYPREQFAARSDRAIVTIGPNELRADSDGVHVVLSGTTNLGENVSARFHFVPKIAPAPIEREFLSRRMTGSEHRWIFANPLCDVSGEIVSGDRRTMFRGAGHRDHHFGTGPIGPGLVRWLHGRTLFPDRCVMFKLAQPLVGEMQNEIDVIEADAGGVRGVDVKRADFDWSLRNYPLSARFDDTLLLDSPRLVDSSRFAVRVRYDANFRGQRGHAICEVGYPRRAQLLSWPRR